MTDGNRWLLHILGNCIDLTDSEIVYRSGFVRSFLRYQPQQKITDGDSDWIFGHDLVHSAGGGLLLLFNSITHPSIMTYSPG